MPRTRGECPSVRPCPFVTCRYHLAVEVSVSGRAIRYRQGWEQDGLPTCALDVAEAGPMRVVDMAQLLGLDPHELTAIVRRAIEKMRMALEAGL